MAGVLTDTGASSRLLDLSRDGAFEIVVSPRLLGEFRSTMSEPRIARRYPRGVALADALVEEIERSAVVVDDPDDPTRYVPDDPGDDYLPALALAAGADVLVTRDAHLEKVEIAGLAITTPGLLVRELQRWGF